MPFYQKRGKIPSKKHIQFVNKNGDLYWEELISRGGFSHIYSNVYHVHPPTAIKKVGEFKALELKEHFQTHRPHHLYTSRLNLKGDYLSSRVPLFYNQDIIISKGHMTQSMKYLYRNGRRDEIIFVHSGKGSFLSNFGSLDINQGDYIVIPRGVTWQIQINEKMHFLIIESKHPISTPDRYRNEFGQLLEHAPFCERDIQTPNFENPKNDEEIEVKVKVNGGIQSYIYSYHPFDLIGWDGYYFPYILNINNFMPITGKIHQPPPVHQTFETPAFVICSFCPRLYDYHPEAIPAPYNHSNIDSDEVLYYVDGDFMSRNDIEIGQITLHPSGIPHGPHPGAYERSIGKKSTEELAVMVDTFKPLKLTIQALDLEIKDYYKSWMH